MALQLPLTRKSDAAPDVAPAWHPNFRNFERLPDIKVVRTTFFINTAAVAAALALVLWVSYREYHIQNLQGQIDDAQAEIDRDQKQNAEALKLSKVFADEEKKLVEAGAFMRAAITPSQFVMHLGQSLPKEVQIDYAEMRLGDGNNAQCILRGLVAGSKEQASGLASTYVESLRTSPIFRPLFDSVSLTSLNADSRSNAMAFEIVLKFKQEGKKS
jgi:hypothetical protein